MPRDAVAITSAASGAAVTTPAGTTINPTNGANIAAVGDTTRLLVRVTNTDAAPHNVTIKASPDVPVAPRHGLGDLVVSVPATTGDVLLILESARFVKKDGSVDVDFAASFAGKISAVRLPKVS